MGTATKGPGAALYGGDLILQDFEPPPDPIMTQPQIAALLTRYDEQVQRVRELESLIQVSAK